MVYYLRKRKKGEWKKRVNTNELRRKLILKGLTTIDLIKRMGMNEATFYRKMNGKSDFYRREIQQMREILGLSADEVDRIFFEQKLT